jgi:hypothetical protein
MIVKEYASEAGHWYTRDGVPQYTVESKEGKERPTTLRDARRMDLVPSVTTILNVAAKPGLIAWMQRQILMAALTLPRMEDESEEVFLERILHDSKEQGKRAADAGTDIHAQIQSFYEDKPTPSSDTVMATDRILYQTFGDQKWVCERSFAHDLGFGGKVDLIGDDVVVDIKTKDFTDPNSVEPYDEHLMQLAAYRVGLGMHKARCANVFVSRTVPGLVTAHEWTETDLKRGWTMFAALLSFWQAKNRHQ